MRRLSTRGRSLWRVLGVAAALALVSSACGAEEDEAADVDAPAESSDDTAEPAAEPETVTFITQVAETEEDGIREVAARFTEQTGIPVEVQFMAAGDMQLLMTSQIESGNVQVDVAALPNDSLYPFVSEGLVEDLTDLAPELDPEVPESLLDGGTVDGRLLFTPFRGNVMLTYYRTDLFEELGLEPPTDFDGWYDACVALSEQMGGPACLFQGAMDPIEVNPTHAWSWIVAHGGDPTVLNDDGTVEAYEFLQRLQQDSLLHPDTQIARWDTSNESFARGDVALMQNWPFGIGVLQDLGVSDFEVYSGPVGPARAAHVLGGDVLAIVKDTPRKDEAWEFIKYLLGAEAQGVLASMNGWPTFRDDALADVPAEDLAAFEAMSEAMSNGIVRPNEPWLGDLYELMVQAWDRIVLNGEDARSVLDELAQELSAAKSSA